MAFVNQNERHTTDQLNTIIPSAGDILYDTDKRVLVAGDGLTVGGNPVNRSNVWNDFSVPLTRDKQGQAEKPDYDFTNLGLLFPQNDAGEIVYLVLQSDHSKKLNTDIFFHVHYIQDQVTQPTFKLDYKFYNNGDTVPASFTTISTADGNKGVFTYTSGSLLQIASFPGITSPMDETVSSNLDIKFYRDDNDATGDVLAKYLDYHYMKDTAGSYQQFSKGF